MSTVNLGSHARRSGLVTYLFALFVFGHSFALAQDTPDEITKHQLAESSERAKIVSDEMSKYEEQYSRLFDEYTTSLRRMANSVEPNAAREREFSILLNVGNDLDRTNSDFSTLRGYMHLTGMVTRKQFLPRCDACCDVTAYHHDKANEGFQPIHRTKPTSIQRPRDNQAVTGSERSFPLFRRVS